MRAKALWRHVATCNLKERCHVDKWVLNTTTPLRDLYAQGVVKCVKSCGISGVVIFLSVGSVRR